MPIFPEKNYLHIHMYTQIIYFAAINELAVKWISDTVLSNLRCHANFADTAANLVPNTKNLFNVKFYY